MKKYFLLFLCILVLTGCQVNRQDNKTVNKVDDNSTKKVKELRDINLSEDELKKIKSFISILPDDKEEYSKSMAAKDLNNQELLGIAYGETKEEVENKINDYFGQNIKVQMEDYICPLCMNVMKKYDSSTGTFTFNELHPGHGGSVFSSSQEILNVQTDDEKYYVKVAKMYSDSFMAESIYNSLEDIANGQNAIIENIYDTEYCSLSDNVCDYKKMFMDNIDKFNTYTYVFNKEKDNLYFEEYSIDE